MPELPLHYMQLLMLLLSQVTLSVPLKLVIVNTPSSGSDAILMPCSKPVWNRPFPFSLYQISKLVFYRKGVFLSFTSLTP